MRDARRFSLTVETLLQLLAARARDDDAYESADRPERHSRELQHPGEENR